MSTSVAEFNATEYIQKANDKEHAARNPTLAPVVAKVIESPAAEPAADQTPKLPSSVRRELNRLRTQLGEAQGEIRVLREMNGEKKPAEENTEPKRDKFAAGAEGDAEFTKALVKFTNGQEQAVKDQSAALAQRITDMGKKCEEDFKLIPDWEAHAKAAEEDGPEIKWDAPENYQLSMLLGTSEYQAMALDYYATHPEELEELVELKGVAQISEFRALEGHLKREYAKLQKKATEAAAGKQTATEPEKGKRPAEAARPKLPTPSESVAAKGGSAPPTEVSPYLADGRTINPAWKEMRNQKSLGR